MGDRKEARPEERKGKEVTLRLPRGEPNRLRRGTAFLCNIRFRNDLPEIPCDPKLILPPFNPQQLAAFRLTELEKASLRRYDLKKDMLFEEDLGIPITAWNIEQYSIPDEPAELHPADAYLLESDEEGGAAAAGARGKAGARGQPGELSWLLRTKYITNAAVEPRRPARTAAAGEEEGEGGELLVPQDREGQIAAIESGFAAAERPPVHHRNPALVPVEVLPVLPDEEMENRDCVLAMFDHDPLADLSRCAGLPPPARAAAISASHLKAFVHAAQGTRDQFVAFLVPRQLPQPVQGDAAAGGQQELQQPGWDAGLAAEQLCGDYEWVREYSHHVKHSKKGQTYLFHMAGDHVGVTPLENTVTLKKRKRQQVAIDDDAPFLQPEKVVVRLPGQEEDWEGAEQQEEDAQQQRQQPDGGREDGRVRAGSEDAAEDDDGGGGQRHGALRRVEWDDDDD
eukprot:scaffold17.g478.t1